MLQEFQCQIFSDGKKFQVWNHWGLKLQLKLAWDFADNTWTIPPLKFANYHLVFKKAINTAA